jgi:tetratricopeptide (TPR) repeat protein
MAAVKDKKSNSAGTLGAAGRLLLWLLTLIVIAAGVAAAGYFVADHALTVRRARPLLRRAQQAFLSGQRAEARRLIGRALAVDPGSEAALGLLARLERERKTPGDWLLWLAAALKPRPARPALDPRMAGRLADQLLRADKALAAGKLDAAADRIGAAAKLAPGSPAVAAYLSALAAARRRAFLRQARPQPGTAVAPATGPKLARVRRRLFEASQALLDGRLGQARTLVAQALEADPENAAAQRFLFEVVAAQRRLTEYLGRIPVLIKNRRLSAAENLVGRVLSMDRVNTAGQKLAARISTLRRRVDVWLAKAKAALEQGRYGQAHRLYNRVLEVDLGHPEVRRGLRVLKAGLRPDDIFGAIRTDDQPLLAAVLSAHPPAVSARLRAGGSRLDGFTPLHLAAWKGSPESAKVLLSHGAAVEARVKGLHTFTPLHVAAFRGHQAVTRLLVARGADLAAKDAQGRTALDVAVDAGRPKLAALLRKLGAADTGTPQRIIHRLFAAAKTGDVETVKRLATGRALASIKSKSLAEIKRIGQTFKSVAGIKIEGDKAFAKVVFDVSKVMTAQERRQLKQQLPALRRMARSTADPAARRNLEQKIADLEKGLVRVTVTLNKVGGRWLVADLEG